MRMGKIGVDHNIDVEVAWDLETRGAVGRSGYLDRWNVDEGRGEKDNGNQHVAEAMARHKFEGSRQGARTRTQGQLEQTRTQGKV